jgi:type VI secretion system protein ImpE
LFCRIRTVAEITHLKYTAEKPYNEVAMGAKELFDAGNLSGAIEQLTQDVKSNPREQKSRIFLFELLCFAGEFQRAERQLDAIAQTSGDVKVEMGAQAYRGALQAETNRRKVFTGAQHAPKFFSEPPAYAALHIDAVAKLTEDKIAQLEQLLEESGRMQSSVKGEKDGKPFENFRDGDDLISPFLEVFFQSDYYWLPFEQIKRIEIQPPSTLRDLLWTPVTVELQEKVLGNVFVPTLYYGSDVHTNDLVRLGRMTDWKSVGEETIVGVGQRTFFADDNDYPLLEIRKIEFTA